MSLTIARFRAAYLRPSRARLRAEDDFVDSVIDAGVDAVGSAVDGVPGTDGEEPAQTGAGVAQARIDEIRREAAEAACTSDEIYDYESKKCVPGSYEEPECPDGQVWNDAISSCEDAADAPPPVKKKGATGGGGVYKAGSTAVSLSISPLTATLIGGVVGGVVGGVGSAVAKSQKTARNTVIGAVVGGVLWGGASMLYNAK